MYYVKIGKELVSMDTEQRLEDLLMDQDSALSKALLEPVQSVGDHIPSTSKASALDDDDDAVLFFPIFIQGEARKMMESLLYQHSHIEVEQKILTILAKL